MKYTREQIEEEASWIQNQYAGQSAAGMLRQILAENDALRVDAARYRYLTQTMGDYCITDAMENTSGVFKAGAADSVIDAAMESKQ